MAIRVEQRFVLSGLSILFGLPGALVAQLDTSIRPARVLCVGDSITEGFLYSFGFTSGETFYPFRYFLYDELTAGSTRFNVDFVGRNGAILGNDLSSDNGDAWGAPIAGFDQDHEGYSTAQIGDHLRPNVWPAPGARAPRVPHAAGVAPVDEYVSETDPDMVVICLGLNDLQSSINPLTSAPGTEPELVSALVFDLGCAPNPGGVPYPVSMLRLIDSIVSARGAAPANRPVTTADPIYIYICELVVGADNPVPASRYTAFNAAVRDLAMGTFPSPIPNTGAVCPTAASTSLANGVIPAGVHLRIVPPPSGAMAISQLSGSPDYLPSFLADGVHFSTEGAEKFGRNIASVMRPDLGAGVTPAVSMADPSITTTENVGCRDPGCRAIANFSGVTPGPRPSVCGLSLQHGIGALSGADMPRAGGQLQFHMTWLAGCSHAVSFGEARTANPADPSAVWGQCSSLSPLPAGSMVSNGWFLDPTPAHLFLDLETFLGVPYMSGASRLCPGAMPPCDVCSLDVAPVLNSIPFTSSATIKNRPAVVVDIPLTLSIGVAFRVQGFTLVGSATSSSTLFMSNYIDYVVQPPAMP